MKISLLSLSFILFILCLVFLLLNHNDTLAQFVPGQAENYLHLNPLTTQILNNEKQAHLFNWLSEKSSLSIDEWRGIIKNARNELAFFTINGQVFALSKENNNILNYLSDSSISYEKSGKYLYIPQLNLDVFDRYLTDQAWYNQINKTIAFGDFVIYSRDLSKLETNVPLLKKPELYPMMAIGQIHKDYITLSAIGTSTPKKQKLNATNIKTIPTNTNLYFRNINTNDLNLFNLSDYNLEYSILSLLKGPTEVLKTDTGSIIFADKTENSLEELKSNILKTIALLYPVEKEVELPDGSLGIHLVADQSINQYFTSLNNQWGTLAETDESLLDFNLLVEELEKSLSVTINYPNSSTSNVSKCNLPKFRKSSGLYIKINITGWSNLMALNKNQTKTSICID